VGVDGAGVVGSTPTCVARREQLLPVRERRLVVRAVVDGIDERLEVLADDPWAHSGLLALQVVVGDRRDRFGEFVSFVSRNEYRDVVPIGVGRQPGERSRVEGFRVSLSECIVGTVLGVDGWRDDERGG